MAVPMRARRVYRGIVGHRYSSEGTRWRDSDGRWHWRRWVYCSCDWSAGPINGGSPATAVAEHRGHVAFVKARRAAEAAVR